MNWFVSKSKDAYWNLAMEEYIFTHFTKDDIMLIYINDNALVCGKNQNIFEEIEVEKALQDEVDIVRRISGGGAVFHDNQNLNISFISDFKDNDFGDYEKCLKKVIKLLFELSIKAEIDGSDLKIDGKKISGNAQIIRNGRLLQHGTLLFDTDLYRLKRYLKPTDNRYISKSVKSRRSQVENINRYCFLTMNDFTRFIQNGLLKEDSKELLLDKKQMEEIAALAKTKYRSWEWTFGRCPKFWVDFKNCRICVEKGKISKIEGNQGLERIIGEKYNEYRVKRILEMTEGRGWSIDD